MVMDGEAEGYAPHALEVGGALCLLLTIARCKEL